MIIDPIATVDALTGDIEEAAAQLHLVYGTCGCPPRVLLPDCDVYNAALLRVTEEH